MENLTRAKEIHTEGLMSGGWIRLEKQKPSPLIFQSKTHPKFILQFNKVWMVQIRVGEEGSFSYFWEPTQGYLTERGKRPQHFDEKKLSVKLLGLEAKEGDKDDETINNLLRENVKWREEMESHRDKISDLSQQVKSLQYICNTQEKWLRNIRRNRIDEKKSSEDDDRKSSAADKPPFSLPQIKSSFPVLKQSLQQDLPHPSAPQVDHSDPHVVSLPRPHGPQLPEAYDVYGLPPYGMPVPFNGYEPYYNNDMPHPGYDYPMPPMPYNYWYDYPYGNWLEHSNYKYSSMPAPQIPEPVMRQPPRADMSKPMVKHSAQAHIEPPFSAPVLAANGHPSREPYDDQKKQNIKPFRSISHVAEKEQSPKRSRNDSIEIRHKVVAPQPFKAAGEIPDNSVLLAKSGQRRAKGLVMGPHDPTGDKMHRKFRGHRSLKKG